MAINLQPVHVTSMEAEPRCQNRPPRRPPSARPLVFVTKYRRKAFTDKMLKRREEIMREVCADFEAELSSSTARRPRAPARALPAQGSALQADQLASKASAPDICGPSAPGRINRIGAATVLVRSYFAGRCGGAPLTVVRQYIESQKRPVGRGEQRRPVLTCESEQS